MATYLIGDIQGCYSPLQRLLDKVRFDPSKDKLWCCGDVVHRGGQSLEVLRLLHSLGKRVKVTLGNHDLFLLSENARHPNGNTRNREFWPILKAHDREPLIDWLQKQPLVHWSNKHQLLVVHAGVVPQWTVNQTMEYAKEVQDVLRSKKSSKFLIKLTTSKIRRWKGNLSGFQRRSLITSILTRVRFCDANGKALFSSSGPPGSQPSPYLPWFKHKNRATRDVRIAFGHWAAMGLRIKKRYIALDSGCVWGGRLSAYRLQDGQLFQVPGMIRK